MLGIYSILEVLSVSFSIQKALFIQIKVILSHFVFKVRIPTCHDKPGTTQMVQLTQQVV